MQVPPPAARRPPASANRMETIDGETYLSPTLFGLDPGREFLLTVAADKDGRALVAAWGLSAQSEPFKQFLREAARARKQILRKRSHTDGDGGP